MSLVQSDEVWRARYGGKNLQGFVQQEELGEKDRDAGCVCNKQDRIKQCNMRSIKNHYGDYYCQLRL
jgi:hypothetical protein